MHIAVAFLKEDILRKVILALAVASSIASSAWAHSGGTDSNGCHTNHSNGTYHCH
ncbi:YHYH domain-containing protein [Mycoplana dimorpha]